MERYFVCINQIVKMIKASKDIVNLDLDFLADSNARLKELSKAFSKIYNNSAMLETGNVTGSISEIIMDYLRMLTHIDLIKFNNMVKLLNNKEQEIYELMDVLGFIESTIAIASFRKSLPYYSVPEFVEGEISINLEEAYHPLIDNPVVNSISENGNVLLTGSNASGKSTFLKTVAINAILSQTINTSLSKSYKAPKFRIYSSMALRDDLEANNSYYIVEIKSIKRIFDSLDDNKKPLLIFIDEVLKGTNTVERVAASTQILSSLGKSKAFVFAATHDVELTTLLEKEYENYHFRENVTDDEVLFDYKLHKGPATTRNAIKLLSVLGFDKEIVDKSNERAAYFLENASWKVEI
ncbi:MutS-related protein [Lachnospira multipara]|uniref:MutS-related protein n=1 Tax=Lachnospira multipara TaxID=28051 RepID=UPI00138AE9BE|nr:AAA family ATPase [Lachnospira multipara]